MRSLYLIRSQVNVKRQTIEGQVRHGPGTEISVASLTTFPWDSLVVFDPYTHSTQFAKLLHLPSEKEAQGLMRGIEGRDDVILLVFHLPEKGWVSMTHPRQAGDFGPETLGRVSLPTEARFRVRIPPDGSWGNIGLSDAQ